jgi:hypothetical protein
MTKTVYEGDDYLDAEGRAISWSSDEWPDLTASDVEMTVTDSSGTVLSTITGSITDEGEPTQTVLFDYPSAETSKLTKGDGYVLKVTALIGVSDHRATLLTENLAVH